MGRSVLAALLLVAGCSSSSGETPPPGEGGAGGTGGAGGDAGTPAACTPAPEVCNHEDDDCDGRVDEDAATITCGVGACARTVSECSTCRPGAPRPVEICGNGVDDDCDGAADCADEACRDRRVLIAGQVPELSVAARADGFALAYVQAAEARIATFDLDGAHLGGARLGEPTAEDPGMWLGPEAYADGYLVASVLGGRAELTPVSAAGRADPPIPVSVPAPGTPGLVATPTADGIVLASFVLTDRSRVWYARRDRPEQDADWAVVQPPLRTVRVDPAGEGIAYASPDGDVFWQPLDPSFSPAGEPIPLGTYARLGATDVARSDEGDVVLAVYAGGAKLHLHRISGGAVVESRVESILYGGITQLPGGGFAVVDFPEANPGYAVRLRRAGPGLQLGEPVTVVERLRGDEVVYGFLPGNRLVTRDGSSGVMLAGAGCE